MSLCLRVGPRDGIKRKCECECIYSAELDIETLVWTRGRAFPLAWMQERLRCPLCGSRRVTVAYILPNERQTAIARRGLSSTPEMSF
jgi:hypothetical protein